MNVKTKEKKPRDSTDSSEMKIRFMRLGESRISRKTIRIIAGALFASACLLGYFGKRGLDYAEQTKSWPSVESFSTSVEEIEHEDPEFGTISYSYRSTVRYDVEGRRYELTALGSLPSPVRVYYDPNSPWKSVVKPGVESDATNYAFFGAAFLGFLSIAFLVVSISPNSD